MDQAKGEVRWGPANKTIGYDLLAVEIVLNLYEIRRVLIDTGSFVNLFTLNIFNKLDLDKNSLVRIFYTREIQS